ncbi:MAG: hypothetical protein P8Y99_14135 [Calditrichaceae bacterium]
MKSQIMLIPLFLLLFFMIACKQEAVESYRYQLPEQISDGLAVGKLSDVNIDSKLISQAMDSILQNRYKNIHSILIYKDNKLVFEEYFIGHKFRYDTTDHLGELVNWVLLLSASELPSIKVLSKMLTNPYLNIYRITSSLIRMAKTK